MGRIGWMEILFIALVVILLFGAKRLPEVGSAIGNAIRSFKKAVKGVEDDIDSSGSDKGNGSKKHS